MRIGHMCMRMAPRFVPVPVAVRAGGHGLVQVVVVAVVMAMGVLVLQRLVSVLMAVRFGQVQQHAGRKCQQRGRHCPKRSLGQYHLARIALGQPARQGVVPPPQAAVASSTASRPSSCVPPLRPWSSTSTMPPANSSSIAAHTRLSIVSRYRLWASTAVNSASSVSISDALVPLVRCRSQASAIGPATAPKAAMASSRGRSARASRASRSAGCRNSRPASAWFARSSR